MRFTWHSIVVGLLFPLWLSFTNGDALGQSAIVVPSPGYSASDIFLDRAPESIATFGSNLAVFEKSAGLQIANPANGSTVMSLGLPTEYFADYTQDGVTSVWNSFITADPGGNSLWIGFTNVGDTDDRIYQVDLNGNWAPKFALAGNFDMQFSGSKAFLSANQSGLGAGNGAIWQLNPATNQLVDVAHVGGYSVGLGADSQGNVYYSAYGLTPGSQSLFRYSAAQIAGAVSSETPLTLEGAEKLADFADANGPWDIDVDAGDNVVFNLNTSIPPYGTSNQIAVWNGTVGGGANYDVIGRDNGLGHWYSMLETSGDIRNAGGKVYLQDFYNPGIAQLQMVNSWNGGSTTDNFWKTPENWSANAVPQAGEVLYFGGTVQLTPENDFLADTIFGGIHWFSGTGSMTLSGNAIGLNGDVHNYGSSLQTLDLPITLIGSNRAFDAALGDIEVKKPLSEAAPGTGIIKLGSGQLILSAINTYTGTTDIQAGTLVLADGGDISTNSPVSVAAGAILEIGGGSHLLGTIDGEGTTVVDPAATLTAISITQDTLNIGSTQVATVPEPGTFMLMLAAAAGMIFAGRKFCRGE